MATNHTPFSTAYQFWASTMMMGVGLFTTYCNGVLLMPLSCGSPSNCGAVIFSWLFLTADVCGMLAAIAASLACGVPATEALTFSLALSSGMLAKSAGSLSAGVNVHGPCMSLARNQRPEIST
ncbi:hypothetical protein D3C85_1391390 [compost metagenome]